MALEIPNEGQNEEVFHTSRIFFVMLAFGMIVFAAIFGVMFWDTWYRRDNPILPFRLSLGLSVLCIVAVPSCVILSLVSVYRCCFPSSLGISNEGICLFRDAWSGRVNLAWIPYTNLKKIHLAPAVNDVAFRKEVLAMTLIDEHDPSTTIPTSGIGLRVDWDLDGGFQCVIEDCFTSDLTTIAQSIERHRPIHSATANTVEP